MIVWHYSARGTAAFKSIYLFFIYLEQFCWAPFFLCLTSKFVFDAPSVTKETVKQEGGGEGETQAAVEEGGAPGGSQAGGSFITLEDKIYMLLVAVNSCKNPITPQNKIMQYDYCFTQVSSFVFLQGSHRWLPWQNTIFTPGFLRDGCQYSPSFTWWQAFSSIFVKRFYS